MEWWQILLIVLGAVVVWTFLSAVLYKHFFKRFYDILLSGLAILILSPVLIILMIVGSISIFIFMGWPVLFKQPRPGKDEKIFNMYKFRTMTNKKDKTGKLLPDKERLTKYGKILRATSLDELPELFNILLGHMSIVGPRPLIVTYLDYLRPEESEEELQERRQNVMVSFLSSLKNNLKKIKNKSKK